MKSQALRILAVVGLFLAATLVPAYAQSQAIKANIPFDFFAGKGALPAGEYLIGNSTISGVLLIQRQDGRSGAFLMTQSGQKNNASGEAKLVFNCYGDQYFLSQIWRPGTDNVRQLMKSPLEREVAKNGSKPKTETVVAVKK